MHGIMINRLAWGFYTGSGRSLPEYVGPKGRIFSLGQKPPRHLETCNPHTPMDDSHGRTIGRTETGSVGDSVGDNGD
jgi:hypothetical protein